MNCLEINKTGRHFQELRMCKSNKVHSVLPLIVENRWIKTVEREDIDTR